MSVSQPHPSALPPPSRLRARSPSRKNDTQSFFFTLSGRFATPKGRGNGLNLNAPQRISLAEGKYNSRREYHVIEDNISRAIGTYLCLSLRFVPRLHFILHSAFCILRSAMRCASERPLSALEDLYLFTVVGGCDDRHIRRTDHKVLVDYRVVDAHLVRLFLGHILIAAKKVCEASAES